MTSPRRCAGLLALITTVWLRQIHAAEFRRLDGIHRLEKRAQITMPAVLGPRNDDVCDQGMKACPSSLGGGCCPGNYDCAKKSCYATTRGPSTCGGMVGWHACDAVHGGGCCQEGLVCHAAGNCVPASGSSYAHDCPASQYLCPASLEYGCCPEGMGCGVSQCYSTAPTTVTSIKTITTTTHGYSTVITTTAVTVKTPTAPTAAPTLGAGQGAGDNNVLKYFPTAIAQVSPSDISGDNKTSSGLSTAQLGGVIAGAAAFLIIILVAAYIIIRHLNKVVAAVNSKEAGPGKTSPRTKQHRPKTSEDFHSTNPLVSRTSPSPSGKYGARSDMPSERRAQSDSSSHSDMLSSFGGGFRWFNKNNSSKASDNSGPTSLASYFDGILDSSGRAFLQASRSGSRSHGHDRTPHRSRSNARRWGSASQVSSEADSDISGSFLSPSELEARSFVPELPGSLSETESLDDEVGRASKAKIMRYSLQKPALVYENRRSARKLDTDTSKPKPHHLSVVTEEMLSSSDLSKSKKSPTKSNRGGISQWFGED